MGTFLKLAFVHKSVSQTKNALLAYSCMQQGEISEISNNSIEENNILYSKIKGLDNLTTAVLLPTYCNEIYNCSQILSINLDAKVLAVEIYDGEIWLVYLFDKGKELTKYASNPILINEKKEDWYLDLKLIEDNFNVSIQNVDDYIKKHTNKIDIGDVTEALFDFLKLLQYPIEIIQDFSTGYKSLVSNKVIKRVEKSFLTVEDLRKTKKYKAEPIQINVEELTKLFAQEVNLINSFLFCKNCEIPTSENNYFLNIEVLHLEILGNCNSCEEYQKVLLTYGISHMMNKVKNFLDE